MWKGGEAGYSVPDSGFGLQVKYSGVSFFIPEILLSGKAQDPYEKLVSL